MSVSAISSFSPVDFSHSVHQRSEKFKQQFEQLSQDLQSGDLAAAQADFSILAQHAPAPGQSTQTKGPLAQAFEKLSQDLQSGDVASAQQDVSTIQQTFEARSRAFHHQPAPADQRGLSEGTVQSTAAQAYSAMQNS